MQGVELPLVLLALFGFVALRTLIRCGQRYGELFDARLTPEDRHLLASLAFYVLVPLTVAASVVVSLSLLKLWGAHASEVRYVVYWARALVDAETVHPLQRALLAETPTLFGLLIAAGGIVWTLWRPGRAAHNFLRLEVSRVLLGVSLWLQPVLSVWVDDGSMREVFRALNTWQPYAGHAALALHALAGLGLIALWRSPRLRVRYLLLASPIRDDMTEACARLVHDAEDLEARTDLAHGLFAAGDRQAASGVLREVLGRDPSHPRAGYLAGISALERGDAVEATGHLRAAGQRLDEDEGDGARALRFEVILALSAARLALGDNEGALETIEVATESEPREPRALFLHAEALVAAGRVLAARARLERALTHADGGLARTIRERLSRMS